MRALHKTVTNLCCSTEMTDCLWTPHTSSVEKFRLKTAQTLSINDSIIVIVIFQYTVFLHCISSESLNASCRPHWKQRTEKRIGWKKRSKLTLSLDLNCRWRWIWPGHWTRTWSWLIQPPDEDRKWRSALKDRKWTEVMTKSLIRATAEKKERVSWNWGWQPGEYVAECEESDYEQILIDHSLRLRLVSRNAGTKIQKQGEKKKTDGRRRSFQLWQQLRKQKLWGENQKTHILHSLFVKCSNLKLAAESVFVL